MGGAARGGMDWIPRCSVFGEKSTTEEMNEGSFFRVTTADWPAMSRRYRASWPRIFLGGRRRLVRVRAQRKSSQSQQGRKATCSSTVLFHGVMEQGHRPGRDVVAAERHGPGPRLPVEPLRQPRVAREGAVRRAAEALRPQHPAEAPRPPPRPRQHAHGAPRERRRRVQQQQQLPRERRRLRVAGGAAAEQCCCLAAGRHGRFGRLAGRGGGRWDGGVCRLAASERGTGRVLLAAGSAARLRSAAG